MRDMTDILNTVKKVAINAVLAMKLTDIEYGTVVSVSPLRIQVDQKKTLEKEDLKLTRAVQDYSVEMTINGTKQLYTVQNGLKAGEKVTMIRTHGGQQYLVIDKE